MTLALLCCYPDFPLSVGLKVNVKLFAFAVSVLVRLCTTIMLLT